MSPLSIEGAGTSLFIRLPYSIKYDWIEKMKTNYSVIFLSMLMASAASAQTDAWFYKAFGQSTDSNFSSNVLPASYPAHPDLGATSVALAIKSAAL